MQLDSVEPSKVEFNIVQEHKDECEEELVFEILLKIEHVYHTIGHEQRGYLNQK